MDKSRIFIASSGRTLVLAEKLRDELQTDFCEAMLWSDVGKRQPGLTIIEMLENAADKFDFAIIILARDDVIVREAGDTSARKARDNCVFEAGLFIAALGRNRCFLVNSVKQEDLPSDLAGIISKTFVEPPNLDDRDACAKAIAGVAADLKDSVQREGTYSSHARVPILSLDEVFKRERPQNEKGDLLEGQVVVCDLQPMITPKLAAQVRRNLDAGIRYFYFLYFSDDTIEKICKALQILLVAGVVGTEKAADLDFGARANVFVSEKDRILHDLRRICSDRSLRIALFSPEPQFCFRIHNASDPDQARLYLRFRASGFVPWAEGASAVSIWRSLPTFLADDESERIFVSLKFFPIDGEKSQRLEASLDRELRTCFPGIKDEVKQLCWVHKS